MSDPQAPEPIPEQPAWDREAARARYRRFMRSWPMRLSYLVLVLVLLFAWGWGIAAAFAPDVENLPGHDIAVPTNTCVTCHTVGAQAAAAPIMNHPQAPSCGFCHRQSLPEGLAPAGGWVRRIEKGPHPRPLSRADARERGAESGSRADGRERGAESGSPSPVRQDGRGG